ncbi:MAG: hypothetical protein J4400_02130 [Candidatus Aenigmarchaeota archaeon]|nr:hypothetical protein [Candidatus Aenigmarchaeota archaeon]
MGAWHPECALNTCCLKAAVLGAFKIITPVMRLILRLTYLKTYIVNARLMETSRHD